MRVLAFDATGPVVTVGLAADGKPIARHDIPAVRSHGSVLELAIDEVLSHAGSSRRGVQGLALVTGPGSLTATRIGWATAAGWAQAMSIPVTGWPTPVTHHRYWTELSRAAQPDSRTRTCCLVHYRGDAFYCYEFAREHPPGEPIIVRLGAWSPSGAPRVRIVGPGAVGRANRDRWRAALGSDVELADESECLVGGDVLAVWGEEALRTEGGISLDRSPLDYGLPPDFRRWNGP